MAHWLWFHAGLDDGTDAWYLFPSGWGSILLPWLGVYLAMLWHHQCHVTRCYRYARRTTAAGERACHKHHPDRRKLTAEELRRRHHLFLGDHPGAG